MNNLSQNERWLFASLKCFHMWNFYILLWNNICWQDDNLCKKYDSDDSHNYQAVHRGWKTLVNIYPFHPRRNKDSTAPVINVLQWTLTDWPNRLNRILNHPAHHLAQGYPQYMEQNRYSSPTVYSVAKKVIKRRSSLVYGQLKLLQDLNLMDEKRSNKQQKW